jgi:hypothetical protein
VTAARAECVGACWRVWSHPSRGRRSGSRLPAGPLRAGRTGCAVSPKRRPAPSRTAPATRRCWRWQRGPRACPERRTTTRCRRLAAAKGFAPSEAFEEVATAPKDALANGRTLDKNELHEELRRRVRADVMPWCRGCRSRHVAPMLWRYATVKAGARLDSERRYRKGEPGRTPTGSEAVRRFLGFYGPAKPGDFAEWAGLAKPHAQRLWDEAAGDLAEVRVGESKGWLMREDVGALESRARSRLTSVAKAVAAPSRCALLASARSASTLARPARPQSAESAGARRHTSTTQRLRLESNWTLIPRRSTARVAAGRCPMTSSVVSRKSAPPVRVNRGRDDESPAGARRSCDAPKRTRTSTRLSRTRPSTWSPACQVRPGRGVERSPVSRRGRYGRIGRAGC